MNNAIDDLKDPKRILPRSIVISLLICIVVYLLTFSSYFTGLSAYDIIMSEATAVSFTDRVYSPLSYLIPVGVTMSCVGGENHALRPGMLTGVISSGIGKYLHYRTNVQR